MHRHRDAASRRFRGVDAPLRETKRSTSCCVARLIFFNFWCRGTILFACGARVEFYLLQCKKCQENVLRQLLAPTVSFWRVFQRIHSFIQEGRGHPPRPPTPSKNPIQNPMQNPHPKPYPNCIQIKFQGRPTSQSASK